MLEWPKVGRLASIIIIRTHANYLKEACAQFTSHCKRFPAKKFSQKNLFDFMASVKDLAEGVFVDESAMLAQGFNNELRAIKD